MPKIIYIDHDDKKTEVEVPLGWSVMEGAINNEVAGIEADCGGCVSCATCHVYVDEGWVGKLTAQEDDELDMLECTACDARPESRLSCQIIVTDELDGLVVRLPEFQS